MIRAVEFCEKYGLAPNALYEAVSNEAIPKKILVKVGDELCINEEYVLRRYNFKLKVVKEAQKMCYYLARYFKTSEIAYILNKIDSEHSEQSWRQLLDDKLFRQTSRSVLSYKISSMTYKLYRYERWFLARLFKSKGYKLSNCDLDKVHFLKEKKR